MPPPFKVWLCQIDEATCCANFVATNGIDLSCSSCAQADRCREHGGSGAKAHPLVTDEPFGISDCFNDARWPFAAQEPEVRSAYILPLRFQESTLGVMVLGHPSLDGLKDGELTFARSLAAGVTGILVASLEFTSLVETLEERVRDASLHLRELVAWAGRPQNTLSADLTARVGSLSEREREVLSAFLGGDSPDAIAGSLFISPHTVRNHMKSMFRKLGVHSRSELLQRFQSSF
ncbi:MAG: LuxR C-terminal-related transcriptional regulator [Myxococcota bacterium]